MQTQRFMPRPRPQRSCNACARRKVRCDRVKPICGRCSRTGLECLYSSASTIGPTHQGLRIIDETPASVSGQGSWPERIGHLGQMVDDYIASPDSMSDESEGSSQSSSQAATTEHPGHLHLGSQGKARYISPAHFAMIHQEVAEINALLQSQQPYSVDQLPGRGRNTLGSLSLAKEGSRSSLGTPSRNDDSEKLLYGDIFPRVPDWTPHDDMFHHSSKILSFDEAITGLPSWEKMEALIWAYMMGYQTISPLFRAPTFLQEVYRCQAWMQGSAPEYEVSSQFLALLAAVVFAGAVICPRHQLQQAFGDVDRETLSSQLYKHAVGTIRLANFPQSPSLYSLSAFIIVDTTWLREEQPLTCCAFVGVADKNVVTEQDKEHTRNIILTFAGLHRDPSTFPDLSVEEIQIRRQIWWALVSIDLQVALASGLPPLIDCSFYAVQSINEAPEGTTLRPSLPGADSKSVLGILVGGKIRFGQMANEFLHILHSTSLGKSGIDRCLEITRRINEEMVSRQNQIETLAQNFPERGVIGGVSREENIVNTTENNSILARFAKVLLSLLAAKPYPIIYGPVRRHNLMQYLFEKDPTVILNCRRYLRHFLQLTQSRDFQPWHWCWPGQHQPLHSLMAIIVDLEENPHNPVAAESRKLVDLAFYMCGGRSTGILSDEQGSINPRPLDEGGSEVWNYLRRARARAWQKANLDFSVLRCPASADDIRINDEDEVSGSQQLGASNFQEHVWGPVPQSHEDWFSLANATDASMNFIGHEFGFQ